MMMLFTGSRIGGRASPAGERWDPHLQDLIGWPETTAQQCAAEPLRFPPGPLTAQTTLNNIANSGPIESIPPRLIPFESFVEVQAR
jgi:hypothetical protein